jgi:type II secretory pathway pseudopilin PulG
MTHHPHRPAHAPATRIDALPTPAAARPSGEDSGDDGYTLIELLVSITIATAMCALAMSAFLQIRNMVNRAESRIAMHAAAQSLYGALHRSLSSAAPGCAVVLYSTPVVTDPLTGIPTGGDVTLIFMHGKEDTEDFYWDGASKPKALQLESDLLWEQWKWNAATATLSSATSNPTRSFTITQPLTTSGISYTGRGFDALPQPRRAFAAVDAATLRRAMDDNIYFPNTAAVGSNPPFTTSIGAPGAYGDVGDFDELQALSVPVLAQVTAFSVQVVAHDGTVTPSATTAVDGSASSFTLFKGVWQDGRLNEPLPGVLNNSLTTPQSWAASAAAKRPAIVRIRFTVTDARVGLSEPFTFSFALPGMTPNL